MKVMKSVISVSLIVATCIATSPVPAFAQSDASSSQIDPKNVIDDAHVNAALRVLKISHAGERKSNLDGFTGKTAMYIGAGLVGTGAVALAVDFVMTNSAAVAAGSDTFMVGLYGTFGVTLGLPTIVMGAIVALVETVSPSAAHAAALDDYFLYSSENYRKFLSLPIAEQQGILRYSANLRLVTVGIATDISAQARQIAKPI